MSLQNKCAKCGCEDSYLTTPPPFPTAVGCPFDECAEIQYAQCIMYTGGDILCDNDLVVPTDTNMAAAITNIIDYFCDKTTVSTAILCSTDTVVAPGLSIVPALASVVTYFCAQTTVTTDLDCGLTTVVTSGTTVTDALEDIINYFCTAVANVPTVTILGDNGIAVTPVVVGNNTEYTISSTGVKKLVKEFTNVEFDGVTLTIPGTELTACGLLSPSCGVNTTKASDFTFNVMYLFAGVWIGLTNETGVSVTANNTTGDISVILNIAPADPGVTVRVTIIG